MKRKIDESFQSPQKCPEKKKCSDMCMPNIIRQLKEKFNKSDSQAEKIQILTIFSDSMTLRDIVSFFGCSYRMAQNAKKLVAQKGILSTPNPKHGKKLSEDTVNKVKDYYLSDEVSRVMPGKRDFVSLKINDQKVHCQKRLVLNNLKELHKAFLEENMDMKIGFSSFALLRPKQCVLPGASGTHSVCVCTSHQNIKLMHAAGNFNKVSNIIDYKHSMACVTLHIALLY